ncbi:hypothetical protein D3C87_1594720 [compost metagenome]
MFRAVVAAATVTRPVTASGAGTVVVVPEGKPRSWDCVNTFAVEGVFVAAPAGVVVVISKLRREPVSE